MYILLTNICPFVGKNVYIYVFIEVQLLFKGHFFCFWEIYAYQIFDKNNLTNEF